MSFLLNPRSEKNLIGVVPILQKVVRWAAYHCPDTYTFVVTEGLRTKARQKALYDQGLSKTLDSYHLTGHAVDLAVIVAGKAVWKFDAYERLNEVMQAGGKHFGVPLTWGGEWVSLRDGPHFQVPRTP
jgi:peptidoglycan L-alanyl-D-glutamate endopeptidase CwlK